MRGNVLVLSSFVLALAAATLPAQSTDLGKQVYSAAANSVFLVYLNDSSGNPTALGTAFLVKPRLLVTNAHVAEAGSPVLAVGPVRVPLKIVRLDRENDLAVMSVDVDLTSKPLPLAPSAPKPGEEIFAIGNPEGLEKTISQGIVSGVRNVDGKKLIQISSPISHGSSGGPILNNRSEVIGVAVAFLSDGQNLNFAVPAEYVRALLETKAAQVKTPGAEQILAEVASAWAAREKLDYSNQPDSDYNKLTESISDDLRNVVRESNSSDALREVACYGTKDWTFGDSGVAAARKLVHLTPSAENQALLGYVLLERAESAKLTADFSDKGSDQEKSALAEQEGFLTEAVSTASLSVKEGRGSSSLLANYVLGGADDIRGDFVEAIHHYLPLAAGDINQCGEDLTKLAVQNLIRENQKTQRLDEAERWFSVYESKYTPSAYDWDSEGDRQYSLKGFKSAASAYEKAASDGAFYRYDYCFATGAHYFQDPTDEDGVLQDGKACIDAYAQNTYKSNDGYFSSELPFVHEFMADVLQRRGVYDGALDHAREAIRLKPDYAAAMDTEGTIYLNTQRFSECESVEKEAVRVSDGKYPYMQFRLGTCYFSEENWAMAENSFRIAANADRTDAASAFNLGLSLSRQGMDSDAQVWFREALKRNPDPELRAKIQNALR
ncbi:MAG: trypsin-like peptidase domain-containing protein [Acidobacteriota bacterium]